MMTLGLPSHLAPQSINRSYARALHLVGFTNLIAGLLAAIVFQAANPHDVLWPAMIAILPMLVLLWLDDRTRSAFYSASFLIVGAACTYWYILTFYSQAEPIVSSDSFSTAMPMIALVMVGGVGRSLPVRLAWCVAGYAAAEIGSTAAILQSGRPVLFNVTTFLAFAATVFLLSLAHLGRQRSRHSQPLIYRAARDEQLAAMRYRIELKATALLHDTVLSHLAAIATSAPGSEIGALRAPIERDLQLLIGEEWLREDPAEADTPSRPGWQQSGLCTAIQEVRAMGLDIESTGDLTAVSGLDREGSIALGLAVKQCLVNVLRHAGTDRAEVAVYGAEGEVSVMVIDSGRGFSEAETGVDRLGLRNSVRRRIESVGGDVHVWSTLGHGTSIMIRVPTKQTLAPGAS
jgi:hypothetical protein